MGGIFYIATGERSFGLQLGGMVNGPLCALGASSEEALRRAGERQDLWARDKIFKRVSRPVVDSLEYAERAEGEEEASSEERERRGRGVCDQNRRAGVLITVLPEPELGGGFLDSQGEWDVW